MAWKRISGPREVDQIESYDMTRGWGYTIRRGDEERTIGVIVARGISVGDLPTDSAAAMQTRGRSAVDAVLDQDEPPRFLVVTSSGIREDRP